MRNRISNTYQNLSLETKAAIWYVFCNLIQKFVVFFCTPIYTRFLSPAQYGELTLYQSWFSIFGVLCTLNLFYSGFTAGITRFEYDSKKYTACSVWLTVFTTIAVASLSIVINYRCDFIGIDRKYFILMFVEIVGFSAFNFFVAYRRFYYSYKSVVIISLAMTVAMSCFSVFAVIFLPVEIRLDGRVFAEVATWSVVGIICLIFISRESFTIYDVKYWKYNLRNNIPLIPHYLSSTILNQSDRIMIARMWGLVESGQYGLAYSMSMFLTAITAAIQNAFNPFLFRHIRKKETGNIKYIINGLVVMMTSLCFIVVLVAPEIIRIIAPIEYWGVEFVMAPIVSSVFFIYLYGVFSAIEHYYGKTFNIMIISVICAAFNIILNFLFIPIFGYIAAGYTTMVSYILLAFFHLFLSKRLLREHLIEGYFDDKFIVFIAIINIIICISISLIYENPEIRYVLLITIISIFITKHDKILSLLTTFKISGE